MSELKTEIESILVANKKYYQSQACVMYLTFNILSIFGRIVNNVNSILFARK